MFNLYREGTPLEDMSRIEQLHKITIRNQRLNQLLILYGLAVTNEIASMFDHCVKKLADRIGDYSLSYEEAR